MANKKPYTFKITLPQLKWLKEESQKTGLNQVEIIRRALDVYAQVEAEKGQKDILTPEQRREIKQIALEKGVSEARVIRSVLEKELRHRERLKKA